MKVTRLALKIAAAIMLVAAAACAIAAYWDNLVDIFYTIADKIEERKADCCIDSSEFDDYDDSALEQG